MRNLLYVLFIQGKWGLKKWQGSNKTVLEVCEHPHQNYVYFLSQIDVCLLKSSKNRYYFLDQVLVHYTVDVTPITDRHFLNCSILSIVEWLLKKMCLVFCWFYIQRHYKLLYFEMLLPTVELSKKVNQWL